MTLVRLAGWQLVNAFRAACPLTWLRRSLLVIGVCAEAALLGWLLVFVPRPSTPLHPGILIGFGGINLLFATAAATRGMAALLQAPEQLTLYRVSPLSPSFGLYLPLVPVIVVASLPLAFLLLPVVAWEGRVFPLLGLTLMAGGLCALAWALVVSVNLAAWVSRKAGRERASGILRLIGGALALVTMLGFAALLRFRGSTFGLTALIGASALLLPPAWSRTSGQLSKTLQMPAAEIRPYDPVWGRPGWSGTLRRTLGMPMCASALIFLIVYALDPAARTVAVVVLVVTGVAAPVDRLMSPELELPDRLALAPLGRAYRRSLILGVGSVSVAGGVLLAAATLHSAAQTVALAAILCLVPVTYFIGARALRITAQFALFAAAFTGALLLAR